MCDTNIIIEFYKSNNQIIKTLKKIKENNIDISIITAGELLFGALNKKELSIIQNSIYSLNLIEINTDISSIFINLMSKYSLSHRISIPDCLIASTAVSYNIPLYTLNKKDFKFIEGINIYE